MGSVLPCFFGVIIHFVIINPIGLPGYIMQLHTIACFVSQQPNREINVTVALLMKMN